MLRLLCSCTSSYLTASLPLSEGTTPAYSTAKSSKRRISHVESVQESTSLNNTIF